MAVDYESILAPYACRSSFSRGRVHEEPESPHRNAYQRDRDRIIHSASFRRLEYKTQVFVNHEGDHYRTRLTHSIEVAQIARSICRSMSLHEDLAEAVALAHDLGHTPFGHSGQDALDEMMKPYGGFEHNRQSLRVVEQLEHKYAAFTGLNLSYETREGIVKHHSAYDTPRNRDLAHFNLHEQPPLEAQIGNLADEIAYNNHDIDDGYRAGMLSVDGLMQLELFCIHYEQAESEFPDASERLKVNETVRHMINFLIVDVIEETLLRIDESGVKTFDGVRAASTTLPLLEPTSVSTVSLASAGAILRNTPSIAPTGTATTTTSAPLTAASRSVSARSITPSALALARCCTSRPAPTTSATTPARFSARASEPPISPTPIIVNCLITNLT